MRQAILLGLLLLLVAAGFVGWIHYRSAAYDHWVAESAAENGIDFYLVKALIYEESWFSAQHSGIRRRTWPDAGFHGGCARFRRKKDYPLFRKLRFWNPG